MPHFEFVDPGYGLDSSMRGKAIPWRAYIHAYAWQIAAYLRARSLHERIGFDVIHHVTYVRYYTPSFLSLLPVPFLWGPVGGGETAPLSFWRDFGVRGLTHETLRTAARRLGELDPFVRMTARRSALARATTVETATRLRRIGARNIEVFPEQGLSEAEIQALGGNWNAESELGGTGAFLSIARLLHWKGIHLGLRAFAVARMPGVEYWIVGTGPERARLESLARRLGVAARVRFMGELPREEVLGLLGQSLALVHPSLHDSGGVVCIESMGAGKPVICLNTGGPATQVTAATGFLIPATTPQECVRGIARAMRTLAENEQLREELGQNALRHTRELFSWEQRGRLISGLYEQLVARSFDDREG
jgi:glycosyltransferase involved in cell wall biosynthesis